MTFGALAQEAPNDEIKALEQELEQLKQQYEHQQQAIQKLKEPPPAEEKEEEKKEALKRAIQELKAMLKAQQEELEKLRHSFAIHKRPPSATQRLEGKAVHYSLWFDPSRWNPVSTAKINPLAEYALAHQPSGGNIFAMVIAEPLEVPRDKLKTLVLEQFKQQLPDAQITLESKRIVDGAELLCLQIEGTLKQLGEVSVSLPATYFGCYYTGKPGTIQIITYASNPQLFTQYHKDIEALMDGFEIGQAP
ncbi:MAG: hypothetical protein D6819_10550 [Gammaproteobacteria bacterium]|nr:MAG: hypothetical protein D6819_10550 [Gammaproteobacteria bacterium]